MARFPAINTIHRHSLRRHNRSWEGGIEALTTLMVRTWQATACASDAHIAIWQTHWKLISFLQTLLPADPILHLSSYGVLERRH